MLKPLRPSSHQHFTTCHYHHALICGFPFPKHPPTPALSRARGREGKRKWVISATTLCCNIRDRRGQMSSSHAVLSRLRRYKQMVLHLFNGQKKFMHTPNIDVYFYKHSATPFKMSHTPSLGTRSENRKKKPRAAQPPKESQCKQSHLQKCSN